MLEIALRLVLGVAAAVAGALLARRSLKAATGAGAVLLALVLAKVAVGYIPAAEPTLFPWDAYPYVERWWYEIPALGLLGAGLWVARDSMLKRDAVLVAGGLLIARIVLVMALTAGGSPPLQGRVRADGLCLQTSGYTCGAAAAAMYLDRLGVPATEAEMAALCVTRRDGTTDAGIARGLRRKLPGRDVRVTAPRYEDLQAPALVSILLPGRIGHAVLVEEATPEGVRLADPGCGRWRTSRADFEARWQGSAIRAQ